MTTTTAAPPPVEGAPAAPPPGSGSGKVRAGILLSRIAGLVRERVFAQYFGTSLYADVFRAGLRLPNLLQNLLGEGTLSASFIPVYAELLEQKRNEEAGRVAGAVFALLLALAGALTLVGVLGAPIMVRLFLPGFTGERQALTITLVRILFPMTGLLVLSAWALGILNSHRHFFLPYFAPVLWNVAIIGAFLLCGGVLDMASADLVLAVGVGALLGGFLQFLVQLPGVLRLERGLKIRWDLKLQGVRDAVRNASDAIVGRGVVQLSGYIDGVMASVLAVGAVAAIGCAQTIYMLPVSLFGMAVAAAELPELSRQRNAAVQVLQERTSAAMRRVAFYVVPTFVAFVVLGDVWVAALYQTGRFGRNETLLVYVVLVGYAVGLLASTTTRLFSSALFAMRDTATPKRIAIIRVVVSSVLSFILMVQFEPIPQIGLSAGVFGELRVGGLPLGPVGLALGAGVSSWLEWVLLRRALRKQIGSFGVGAVRLVQMFGASGAGAAAGWGARLVLPPVHPLVTAAVVGAAFGAVYLGITAALGVEDARSLTGKLTRRLRR
ncbi:MAG: murein biosynthesis integral membrane protein MurJ [Myxococcota bacterium]